MKAPRFALALGALFVIFSIVAAQDACALFPNVGQAWVGTPNQYVFLALMALFLFIFTHPGVTIICASPRNPFWSFHRLE